MDNKNKQQPTVEDRFRSDLDSTQAIVAVLGSYCETIEELKQSIALALKNTTHLRLIMRLIADAAGPSEEETE